MTDHNAPSTPAIEEVAPSPTSPQRTSVAVYVCTYRRNGPLLSLLSNLSVAAETVQPDIAVAVVVVDDNPDGRAKTVVDSFNQSSDRSFDLGLHYTHTGSQNISTARNRGVEEAMKLADWVAMTDDDQSVSTVWLAELFAMQRRFDADAVTGPVFVRYADDCPPWIHDQPFSDLFEAQPRADGEKVDTCSTGNSMIRTSWLRSHPEVRFRKDLGKLGGEDMVFYRGAIQQGLQAFYALKAEAYQVQPPERSTFGFHLVSAYWLGNSTFLTGHEAGEASRGRLALRGSRKLIEAVISPFRRAVSRQPLHLRFAVTEIAHAGGILAGVAGVKVRHR